MRATASFLIVIALFVAGFEASRSHAQEPQSILPALLTEVRGLRAAMEQMASAGPQVQLALGRLQLQEQRVNTLVRRLETIRDSMAGAQSQLAQHQSQLALFETAAKNNPSEREEVDHMVAELKRQMTLAAAEVQRLTTEESTVAAEIGTEQARWTDFNQRLEDLERALGRR